MFIAGDGCGKLAIHETTVLDPCTRQRLATLDCDGVQMKRSFNFLPLDRILCVSLAHEERV